MMNKAPTASGPSNWQAKRPLSEPVLESVEAEIGAQAADPGASTPHAPKMAGNGADPSGLFWWDKMRQQLMEQVREQPARSALLALGVGMVAALLMAQGMRRSRRTL
jgi:hypothetical protein